MSEPAEAMTELAGSARDAAKALEFLTRNFQRPSKHRGGRAGQKYKAKARRRGTWGKAVRRRRLAARREVVEARSETALYAKIARFAEAYELVQREGEL